MKIDNNLLNFVLIKSESANKKNKNKEYLICKALVKDFVFSMFSTEFKSSFSKVRLFIKSRFKIVSNKKIMAGAEQMAKYKSKKNFFFSSLKFLKYIIKKKTPMIKKLLIEKKTDVSIISKLKISNLGLSFSK